MEFRIGNYYMNGMINYFKILFIVIFSTHNCFSQISNQIQDDFVAKPKLNWKINLSAKLFSSPIIKNDIVYIGSIEGYFYAIELKNGTIKWKFKTNGEIRSTAIVDNESIYFVSGDGHLNCLNQLGVLKWRFSDGQLDKQYDFADYHNSQPIIKGDIIYAGIGSNMYAINKNDGSLVWKFSSNGIIHSKVALDDNKLFFGSFDGFVYSLRQNDGSLNWKFKTVGHQYFPKGEVQGSPVLSGHLVIIGARDYNVYAIDKEKGYCHWNKVYQKGWVLSNVMHDTLLYMGGADERILACVDSKTGREIWKKDMEFLIFGSPIFSTSMLYVGTTMGKLHGIDKKNGNIKWSFETDSYLKNKNKYLKDDDSYRDDIYTIIKTNEEFLDLQIDLGGIFSTPFISNNSIVFSTSDGFLYSLKRT